MKKKIVFITLVSLIVSINNNAQAQVKEDYIPAPINPLPSTYELNTDKGFDYNLEVPPPINPQPKISHDDNGAVFTTENTGSSEENSDSDIEESSSISNEPTESKSKENNSRKSNKGESIRNTSTKKSPRKKVF